MNIKDFFIKNKKKLIIISSMCIAIAALILTVILLLSKCDRDTFEYDNAEKYRSGDYNQTLAVSSLDIEWLSGKVEILYHSYSSFQCTEYSELPISSESTMHWYYDGDVLRIKPCASGTRADKVKDKTLTVYIPIGLSFNSLKILTEDADISVNQIGAGFLDIESTSGNIELTHIGASKRVSINSGSGDITYDHLAGKSETSVIRSASGKIKLSEAFAPAKLNVTSASGDIELALPEDTKAFFDTKAESGVISAGGFASVPKGDGVSEITLNTSSGNIIIKKR